ncbi:MULTISPECIES: hypothetical protein [Burkholderia]|uniref:RND efflux system outer membrane lipoprotein n=1 Tax=Burkholderia aenigmatica TaxID=2015348 RepID=A0ABY6Y5U4_9BURK|nr:MULTISPECIES: hypothetical protein [Burkholderia]VWD36923.1 RND efflux system outer membrane lipoprotein [Burkholderia aenigmatica]VWD52502.1 RND efflux system outer membrane lipoprotein [Burkholderia aenigmatica]
MTSRLAQAAAAAIADARGVTKWFGEGDARTQAVAQRPQDTVAFYVALGGGWGDAG